MEQSINNVIALKQYIKLIPAVFEALATVESELLLDINAVRRNVTFLRQTLTLESCALRKVLPTCRDSSTTR